MASIIRIKRSSVSGNPGTLGAGELAYSALTDNGSNGGDRLYIGIGGETAGNAANHLIIGGTYFTDKLDHALGTLTASSAILVDSDKKVDNLKVDNLDLNGNTLSTTDTDGNLVLAPNGAGKVSLTSTNVASSTSTGALVVAGGVGIGGALHVGGSISAQAATFTSINNTPIGNSTPNTGAFTVVDVDNINLNGNTISSSDTDGDLILTPNGTGKTVITNPYIGDDVTSLAEYIFDTVGGAITAGTGITITNSDGSDTSTVSITNTAVTPGSYGSSTAIPTFTVNAQGQLTAAGTASITTTLTVGADTGSGDGVALASDTLTLTGGTGIDTSISGDTVTFAIDSSVATNGKKLSFFSATTSAELAGVISDETGSGVLVFGTTPSFTTSVTTGSTSFDVFNTTATTINAFGSAATLSIGAATGTTTVNNDLNLASGKILKIAGTSVLDASTLYSGVTASSLTSVGTIGTGVWQGTTVATGYGGTGLTSFTDGGAVYANSTSSLTTGTLPVASGGTGTVNGSITGTGALNFTAGGTNTSVNLVPQGNGTVDVANKRITSVAEPTQATDAATKNYVDAVKSGFDVKDSVRVATSANLTSTYSNGTSGVGATLTNAGTQAALTIDSIVLTAGDRVLVKDQTTGLQNGFYVVTVVGTASTNWILTRSIDADENSEITPGAFTFVEEGTIADNNGYVCTNNGSITIGTTPITFVQFSGAGSVIAGAGLTKDGNTIDVVGTTDRISISADAVDIASTYVGQTSIVTLGTIATGTWQGSLVAGQYGGTGVDNTGKTITLGGNLTTSGAHATTFTTTGTTGVTLPTTGTLATLAGSESLSNKTITLSSFSGTTIAASGLVTLTNTTNASAVGTAAVVLSGGLSVAKAMYIGTNITGAGAATSTLDGFNIDGGTY